VAAAAHSDYVCLRVTNTLTYLAILLVYQITTQIYTIYTFLLRAAHCIIIISFKDSTCILYRTWSCKSSVISMPFDYVFMITFMITFIILFYILMSYTIISNCFIYFVCAFVILLKHCYVMLCYLLTHSLTHSLTYLLTSTILILLLLLVVVTV